MSEVSELIGKTLMAVDVVRDSSVHDGDQISFTCEDGRSFIMYHSQDCCESVDIEDIVGDVQDLVGAPILVAEEVSNSGEGSDSSEWPKDIKPDGYYAESFTWTFYKFRTIKGSVDIRWYGSSNGYYSESVYFEEIK
jgi:hypothetical protein